MMSYPSIDSLVKKVDNKYTLVTLATMRAVSYTHLDVYKRQDRIRPHIHSFRNLTAALFGCSVFQHFAYTEEEQYTGRFRIFTYSQSTCGSDGHEHIFVKPFTMPDIANQIFKYRPAEKEVAGQKQNNSPKAGYLGQIIQDEPQNVAGQSCRTGSVL